jgi:hypothetical protein
MKKILPIIIALFLTNQVIAIEEIKLEQYQEKTLKEKLSDVYHLEVEQIDKPYFMLNKILTKKHKEESSWESTQLWFGYNADLSNYFNEDKYENSRYNFYAINAGLDGKLKDNKADYRIMLHYVPDATRSFIQNLFADLYVATNAIPHHRIWLGNTRPRVGYEGGYSPYTLPFMLRSQISRNFGSVRRLGLRVTGDYSLVDYDLGIYDSSTYFQSFMPGSQFIGWINFKPLGLTDGRYGRIDMGGGIQAGNQDTSYRVAGAYLGYNYKKWWLNFEYSDADGYNGPIGYVVDKKASGFYSTLAYRFTPKVQGLLRYDEFDPNKNLSGDKRREYTAGINYFIKGQALKFVLNYVFCQNDVTKDSHRFVLGTQILL